MARRSYAAKGPAATPAPGFRPFLARELRAGGLPSCAILAGSEPWFQRDALDALTSVLLPEGDPGGVVTRLDGGRPEDRDAILCAADSIRAASLFADMQVIIVNRADGVNTAGGGKEANLTRIAKAAAACSVKGRMLILLTDKPSKGRGSVATKKLIEAGVWVVDCRALYAAPAPWERGKAPFDTELTRYLAQRTRKIHGARIDLNAAHLLVKRLGTSLSDLDDALKSLAGASAGKPVTEEIVYGAYSDRRSDEVWPLVEAVLGGDNVEARRMLHMMATNGLTGQDGSVQLRHEAMFPLVLATLYNGYRKHALAAAAFAQGHDEAEVLKIAGVPRFLASPFLARVRKRSACDWLASHRHFFDADEGVKSGRVPAQIALERLAMAVVEGR